ncbi:MAG: TM2 domain-containing protein [Candidatus Heteroscillospira sp.]
MSLGKQKPKNKWIAFILFLLFGMLGVHKFYEGKAMMGILYLVTLGLFGIGVFVDLLVLLSKPTEYYP